MSKVANLLAAGALSAGLVASMPAVASATTSTESSSIVIAGAYGGGDNTSPEAAFPYDFVELFNAGSSAQSIGGWSLQYDSTTANAGGVYNWTVDLPTVTLQPGQWYLVTGYGSLTTNPYLYSMPSGDLAENHSANDISRSTFTLYLVDNSTNLWASSGSGATVNDTSSAIVDELGVGAGSGSPRYANGTALGALTNDTAALRLGNGCTNTDDNAKDFEIVTPSASSGTGAYPFDTSTSALTPCSAPASTPESPLAVLLPASGVAILFGSYLYLGGARRRRDRSEVSVA